MNAPVITLASSSPRRRQLLQDAQFNIKVCPPRFDDALLKIHQANLPGRVMSLSWFKARAIPDPLNHELILASDTLLSYQSQAIGKVQSRDEARTLLNTLNQQWHDAWTAVSLWKPKTHQRYIFVDQARLRFTLPQPRELDRYLEQGLWKGKAGAYNLGELKQAWRFEIIGDETTVIGLPMKSLSRALVPFNQS